MAGKYFDEWQVGDTLTHDIRRTVTETDNLLFTTMTHNPQPLHLDAEAAKASEFGQILVNGTFIFSMRFMHFAIALQGDAWQRSRRAMTMLAGAQALQLV